MRHVDNYTNLNILVTFTILIKYSETFKQSSLRHKSKLLLLFKIDKFYQDCLFKSSYQNPSKNIFTFDLNGKE